MIAREHAGRGWGDSADPTKPDVWLAHGYVCAYDPQYPDRAELWTEFGRTDGRFVTTNAGQHRQNEAICKARPIGRPYFADDYEGDEWRYHSRFD